jgi:NAD(P)-dependent dehydrogenase (short-subunit alcohol dehydrogenase family)
MSKEYGKEGGVIINVSSMAGKAAPYMHQPFMYRTLHANTWKPSQTEENGKQWCMWVWE